ncbi:MAG TPA: hypothetical protein IAA15_09885 [Candidatus Olsenella pullicola]|nr:hypothetical protein [Candidatus Olsenella pullicola]
MKPAWRPCALSALMALLVFLAAPSVASAVESAAMYRLYNPWTGEHLYTASEEEYGLLPSCGWRAEGVAWTAPTKSQTPVWRLYNPYAPGGDHHYTTSEQEYNQLQAIGWEGEGIAWYSDDEKGMPLQRLFNPYTAMSAHHYTANLDECSSLIALGWSYEGVAWHGIGTGNTAQGFDWEIDKSGFNRTAAEDLVLLYTAWIPGYDENSTADVNVMRSPGQDAGLDEEFIFSMIYKTFASEHETLSYPNNAYGLVYAKLDNFVNFFVPSETGRQIISSIYGSCPSDLSQFSGTYLTYVGDGWRMGMADGPFGRNIKTSNWQTSGDSVTFDAEVTYSDGIADSTVASYRVEVQRDDESIFGCHLTSIVRTQVRTLVGSGLVRN